MGLSTNTNWNFVNYQIKVWLEIIKLSCASSSVYWIFSFKKQKRQQILVDKYSCCKWKSSSQIIYGKKKEIYNTGIYCPVTAYVTAAHDDLFDLALSQICPCVMTTVKQTSWGVPALILEFMFTTQNKVHNGTSKWRRNALHSVCCWARKKIKTWFI